MKRVLIACVKILILLASLGFVAYLAFKKEFLESIKKMDAHEIASAVAFFLAAVIVISARFYIAVTWSKIKTSLLGIFVVNWAGYFWSIALPGAIGGDISRVLLLKSPNADGPRCAGLVLYDRICGFILLQLCATIGGVLVYFMTHMIIPLIIVGSIDLALLGGLLIYMSPKFRTSKFGGFLKGILPYRDKFKRADTMLKDLLLNFPLTFTCVSISILSAVLSVLCFWEIAMSLTGKSIGFEILMFCVPLIFLVSAIPITPGGLGTQELFGTLMFALTGLSSAESAQVMLVYRGLVTTIALPGGLAGYLYSKLRNGTASRSETVPV